jgi:hypothetical protein
VGNPILGAIAIANDAPEEGKLHGEMYLVKAKVTFCPQRTLTTHKRQYNW